MLRSPWKRPTRRSCSLLTVQSLSPVRAVAPEARMPAALSMPAASSSAPGSRAAVRDVQHHGARPQPDGQVAERRVQRVADPPAAVQQLKGKIVLVPFAEWHQRRR